MRYHLVCGLIALVCLTVSYAASYAPYLRLMYGPDAGDLECYLDPLAHGETGQHLAYTPVEYLLDWRQLADAHDRWAALWLVDERCQYLVDTRSSIRITYIINSWRLRSAISAPADRSPR